MPEVVVDARAAARRQLSGVERWAVELARRLAALRPAAYAVARSPRALAHQAGQAWEQLALLALARGARLVLSPVRRRRTARSSRATAAPWPTPCWRWSATPRWPSGCAPRGGDVLAS